MHKLLLQYGHKNEDQERAEGKQTAPHPKHQKKFHKKCGIEYTVKYIKSTKELGCDQSLRRNTRTCLHIGYALILSA